MSLLLIIVISLLSFYAVGLAVVAACGLYIPIKKNRLSSKKLTFLNVLKDNKASLIFLLVLTCLVLLFSGVLKTKGFLDSSFALMLAGTISFTIIALIWLFWAAYVVFIFVAFNVLVAYVVQKLLGNLQKGMKLKTFLSENKIFILGLMVVSMLALYCTPAFWGRLIQVFINGQFYALLANSPMVFGLIILMVLSTLSISVQIPVLEYLGLRQVVRTDGPKRHLETKKGTLTCGGLVFIIPVLIVFSMYFFCYEYITISWLIGLFLGFMLIGYLDDQQKLNDGKGFKIQFKFMLQLIVALLFSFMIPTEYTTSFFGTLHYLGYFYPFLAALVIVSCVNAVNLTDGLDGLAAFPLAIIFMFLAFFTVSTKAFSSSDLFVYFDADLQVTFLSMLMAAFMLSFLRFNYHPAKLFLGDCGSLAFGAVLAGICLILKLEWFLIIFGALFVIETLSVAIQILYFKYTGKRFFKMAPLHHHYELSGLKERQIVIRLWTFSTIMSIIGFAWSFAVLI